MCITTQQKGTGVYADLKDKVVVITGAGGALAKGVVEFFANASSKLALVDIHDDRIREAFPDLEAQVIGANLTVADDVNQLAEDIFAQQGRLDVLVNIAGGYAGGQNIIEVEEATWDKMMDRNAKSVFLMSHAIAAKMVAAGNGGRIINVGAKQGLRGTKNHGAYGASKAAVIRLGEAMALELKEYGINVNTIVPSTIDTPANRESMPSADFSKWVTPESLANVIGFLSSEVSKDVSGATIPVYGASM